MPNVKRWFRNLSLARKLTAIGVATSTVSVVVACALIAAYDASSSRARLARDTALLAAVVGENSTAAVAFGDAGGAGDTLRAVAVNAHIVSAAIFLPDGKTVFAEYHREGQTSTAPSTVGAEILERHRPWQSFSSSSLLIARPIMLKHDVTDDKVRLVEFVCVLDDGAGFLSLLLGAIRARRDGQCVHVARQGVRRTRFLHGVDRARARVRSTASRRAMAGRSRARGSAQVRTFARPVRAAVDNRLLEQLTWTVVSHSS